MALPQRDPRVEFLFLADQLAPSFPGGNRLDVKGLGLHDVFVREPFPQPITIWIVGQLQWRQEDAEREFRLTYAVRAWQGSAPQPDLFDSFPVTVAANQRSHYPHHQSGLMPAQYLSRLGIRIPALGTYVVEVHLDGRAIVGIPFAVLPP